MGSLDDVFWSRVGLGHKDIDCRGFVALCKDSNLIDDTFQHTHVELVFQRCMPLSRRRLDLPRLKDALRRIAEMKNEEEQAIHRKLIEAHQRNCRPFLKRTGSLPAVVSRQDSPKNGGEPRSRSSGHKRHKHRKKTDDKEKSVQLPSTTPGTPGSPEDQEHRRSDILICPSGESQLSTDCASPLEDDGEDRDLPSPLGLAAATPCSETSTALAIISSWPNTPSCQYLSC